MVLLVMVTSPETTALTEHIRIDEERVKLVPVVLRFKPEIPL